MWVSTSAAFILGASIIVPGKFIDLISEGSFSFVSTDFGGLVLKMEESDIMASMLIFMALALIVLLGSIIYICRQIYTMFRSVYKGNTPFTVATIKRVRNMGMVLIGYNLFDILLYFILKSLVDTASVSVSSTVGGFMAGLLLLCLYGIMGYGVKLQQEVDEPL